MLISAVRDKIKPWHLKFREAKKKMTKILLVEDDGQIAAYLGELLRAEGFDTQIAGSKKEAGECLLAQAFDLVLLDVSLPDGNGFSICAEIKREYEIPVMSTA